MDFTNPVNLAIAGLGALVSVLSGLSWYLVRRSINASLGQIAASINTIMGRLEQLDTAREDARLAHRELRIWARNFAYTVDPDFPPPNGD